MNKTRGEKMKVFLYEWAVAAALRFYMSICIVEIVWCMDIPMVARDVEP